MRQLLLECMVSPIPANGYTWVNPTTFNMACSRSCMAAIPYFVNWARLDSCLSNVSLERAPRAVPDWFRNTIPPATGMGLRLERDNDMKFAFKGFAQDGAYRVFSFEALPRTPELGTFWVRADLSLARKHKISVQELPLLCRAVLENRATESGEHTVVYTDAEMIVHADARDLVNEKRKARRPLFKAEATSAARST
jgi:hypothetical protein